jgi:serine protease Do
VKILRDGRESTIPVVIGDRKDVIREDASLASPDDQPNGGGTQAKLGLTVQPITGDMMRQFGLDSTDGVIVTNVQPGSAAEEAQFSRGMVITQIRINGQVMNIGGIGDFTRAEQAMRSGSDAAFRVMVRNPNNNQYVSRFITVTVP